MSGWSCLDRKRNTINVSCFCRYLAEAIQKDLDKTVDAETLLKDFLATLDDLNLNTLNLDLKGPRFTQVDDYYIPISVAMLGLHPYVESVVEELGVNTPFGDGREQSFPNLFELQGELSVDLITMVHKVETEGKEIGGLLPFEEAIKSQDDLDEIEKQRYIEMSRTGRTLVPVSE